MIKKFKKLLFNNIMSKKKKTSTVTSESESAEDEVTDTIELESSEELLSEKSITNCSVDDIIKEVSFDNNNIKSELTILNGNDRITNPRLTKYEMVRLLGERTKQLIMGAKPLIKNHQDYSYEEIAIQELKLNMIPFKVKRPLPDNKIEIWTIDELDKNHLVELSD